MGLPAAVLTERPRLHGKQRKTGDAQDSTTAALLDDIERDLLET